MPSRRVSACARDSSRARRLHPAGSPADQAQQWLDTELAGHETAALPGTTVAPGMHGRRVRDAGMSAAHEKPDRIEPCQ